MCSQLVRYCTDAYQRHIQSPKKKERVHCTKTLDQRYQTSHLMLCQWSGARFSKIHVDGSNHALHNSGIVGPSVGSCPVPLSTFPWVVL
jgi:hypothetical protein